MAKINDRMKQLNDVPKWDTRVNGKNRTKIKGLYFIYYNDEIVYIGQTKNVGRRYLQYNDRHRCKEHYTGNPIYAHIVDHGRDNHSFRFIKQQTISKMMKKEERLIEILKPRLNVREGGFTKGSKWFQKEE